MQPRLSVNINKIALLRNARGSNIPDVSRFAIDAQQAGAHGITIHPRPDERHITRNDVYALKEVVYTEYNIEGYPTADFIAMIREVKPHQCTLVPDSPQQLTSDHGWDTVTHQDFLKEVVHEIKSAGVRVSLFIDPIEERIAYAQKTGADRIELYTGPYAEAYYTGREEAVRSFTQAAHWCTQHQLGINAGHDLNLDNLAYFKQQVPGLLEVSIGHALVRDCLYFGLQNTIQLYLRQLQ